jgi:NAD(P)-dependent dehydrogenase (short-subunit alcohol dehydrogenase family)
MPALDGKVAVVTGGGTGIGQATARLFAAEGARVVVFARREQPLVETVEAIQRDGGAATHVTGNVAVEEDVSRLVATSKHAYGGIDVVVNCAGVRSHGPAIEMSVADFAEVLRTNLVGAFVLTKAVAPLMRERGGGSIVHIGSALGTVAAPNVSSYIASKGGLHQFARAVAVELIHDGIRVNIVAPGTIDTPIDQWILDFRRHMLTSRIPIRRAGTVEDVAQACLYLGSDASRYVTGAILAVDGGWTAS